MRIHLSEISILILESTAISLTAALLSELSKSKVKVIFCDEKHNPYGELVPYYGSHDTSRSIVRQVGWDDHMMAVIWQIIIKDKLSKQSKILTSYGRPGAAELVRSYIAEVELGDLTNREGHAAKVYFNALFGNAFSRKDDLTMNYALDYGYSIVLACFNREVVSQGKITQIGIWHANTFNFFNLSSDLMEAFRPFVDRYILQFGFEVENVEELTPNEKHEILRLLEMKVLLNGKEQTVINAIRIYTKCVLDALDESDLSLMPILSYV